jgi:hypothetical protein
MKVADWRAYVHEQLRAAPGVSIEAFPSGAVRIKGRGVNALVADLASISRYELEKLTGKDVCEFLGGGAEEKSQAFALQTDHFH